MVALQHQTHIHDGSVDFVKDFLLYRLGKVDSYEFSCKRRREPLELNVFVCGVDCVRHDVKSVINQHWW